MVFGRSKKPDPDSAIPRTESVPPPPPPKAMFDPDVIEAADEEVQAYKEKQSQEVTMKAFAKGTVGDGNNCKRKWYILAALLLLVVIIAAAVGASAASKNSSSNGSAASSSTGGGNTAAGDFGTTTGTTGGGTAGTTGGGTAFEPDAPCVPCTDLQTEFMVADGITCENFDNLQERCGATGSWWFDARDWDDDWVDPNPPQSYCRYSCFMVGVPYPDFNNCCPDVSVEDGSNGVVPDVDPDAPCVPCTDIPDEFMLDNGVDCLTDGGLDEVCATDGSWWYNNRDWDDDWVDPYPAETYCQYTCDQMGLGYPSASPCCAERGSDVNEFYDYGTVTPDFGNLEVNGDCDGENNDLCKLCEGDCDDDVDCEDGYFCFQRDADEDIPGCNGDAEDGTDYCIPEFYRDN